MFVLRAFYPHALIDGPAWSNENETLKRFHKSAHFISPQLTLVPKIDCWGHNKPVTITRPYCKSKMKVK